MPAARMSSAPDIRHIQLAYDHSNSDASALRLIHAIVPEWKTSEGEIEFVHFTDGITNTVCIDALQTEWSNALTCDIL